MYQEDRRGSLKSVILGVLVAALMGCTALGMTIRFVNIPSGTMDSDIVEFQPILDFVEGYVQDAGFDVEIEAIVVMDYSAAIQAMLHGHAEMCRFGPAQYVLLQRESGGGVVPLARDVKGKTGLPFYNTMIIARADSEIPGICSCLVNDLTIAFVDETSTSGYLVPQVTLGKLGLSQDDFAEIYFAGSHEASIIAVWEGHVDIACTNEYRYGLAIDSGTIVESEMSVLAVSDPIPTNPIVVSDSLDPDLIAALQDAWLAVPNEVAAGFGLAGFAPVIDADYNPIRDLEALQE